MTRPISETARRPVIFFDIDNCLYSKRLNIGGMMRGLIREYYLEHLSLPPEECERLQSEYNKSYGFSIAGLVAHHQIDPLEYNSKVDDALPLEGIIKPDPDVSALLKDIDRTEVKPWLLTNAYVNHAKRVISLLGVQDLFEGLTYCDYSQQPIVAKPQKEMYLKAMSEAGVDSVEDCFFVDDSYLNCSGAQQFGWTTAHLLEEGCAVPESPASKFQIRSLQELPSIFPLFFRRSRSDAE